MTPREIYQLYHNKSWIEGLENQEIAYFNVDSLENQWCLYKPKYTTTSTDANRFQTQKNRKGDILLRNKNKPIGFKLCAQDDTDLDGTARKYQAYVNNETLRNILDGNVYDLKIYDSYGTVFGEDAVGNYYAICFSIDNNTLNDSDEEFVTITVVSSTRVTSLYNYVDCLIYNDNFYLITFSETSTLTISKYNIIFNIREGSVSTMFATDQFTTTSENDLSGLSYTPITSRIISINGVLTETIGRIWTTSYSDNNIYLAYECNVPTARSAVTGVTEGIGLISSLMDAFLELNSADLNYYMYDTIEDVAKISDVEYCQAFIPDYTDVRKSFGHSIDIDGTNLIVGSPLEDAFYVFDLEETLTPDLFGSSTTTLSTNGVKFDKDIELELNPVFPIRMYGNMDFEIFGDVDILWRYPDGSLSSSPHATGYLGSTDTYYLFCSNFLNGDVTIKANNTTGFIGSLNDVPNLMYGLDLSNTMASGHLGVNFQGTDINIENTNVSKSDLEYTLIVLDNAGNVSGSITASNGLPTITSPDAIIAVNSLISKGWNVSVNL